MQGVQSSNLKLRRFCCHFLAEGGNITLQECQAGYVSAYAAAHPSADWAESRGHYLPIFDALDTAWAHGLLGRPPRRMPMGQRLAAGARISRVLNEPNRSVARGDA